MSQPGGRMPDLIEELSKAAQECRQLLTELRQERREVRRDLTELATARKELQKMIDEAIDQENVSEIVKDGLADIKAKIDEVSETKCQQIGTMFDRFTAVMLYGNQQERGPNVFDTLFQKMKRGEL